ncbi:MAG: arylesterase [Bacteroidetes bacterium]|nr:arylesterase [Bacteroidota bacterium]
MAKVKIVCIGDSLTEGYQIPAGSCWPNLLNQKSAYEVINSGICGDTTGGMLARFHEMVIVHKPNYVIILGGTNDIWFNIHDHQIISNILAMTRLARHYKIQSIIGIPTPFYLPQADEGSHFFMDLKGMYLRLREYIQTLKRFALDDNQPIIDFSLNMHAGLFLEDGLHPNKEGHQIMAINAKESLSGILLKQ